MADNNESKGRFGNWVSNGQLLIILLTTAFSLYLSVQQTLSYVETKLSIPDPVRFREDEQIKPLIYRPNEHRSSRIWLNSRSSWKMTACGKTLFG